MLALEKTSLTRKNKILRLVQRIGLRRLQRFDVIQVEPPFLLLTQKDF